MAKVAQVLDDVTKMKNVALVQDLLNKSATTTPDGKYFNTSLSQEEQKAVIEALHEILNNANEYTAQYITEKQFEKLQQLFTEMLEDEDVVDVVTTDTDGIDTVVVSTEEPNLEMEDDLEPADDLIDLEDSDALEVDTDDVDVLDTEEELIDLESGEEPLVNIDTDNPTNMDVSVDDSGNLVISAPDGIDITVNNPSARDSAVNEEIDSYTMGDTNDDVTSVEPLDDVDVEVDPERDDIELDNVEDDELSDLEEAQLQQIQDNVNIVLDQIKQFKSKKASVKNNVTESTEENINAKQKKSEKVIYEGLDVLIKKYDTLLENLLKEELEEDEEELDLELDGFELNDDIDTVDDALDKSEDLLTEPSDVVPEEEPSVVHITLPAGVSADDIAVKVIEESEEAPIIQIELPQGADVDEVEATVGEPVSIDGQSEVDVVPEDIPEDMEDAVLDEDLPVDDEEDVIIADDGVEDAELEEDDEDKLEEALKVLNTSLLPIAENAKYNAFQANKNILETAQQADTSYDITSLKQTHLYYMNEGKHTMDYRYPIADVIEGNVYAIPDAIIKMSEMFSNPSMVSKIGAPIVKIARARLTPYLEAMGKKIPWGKKSNLVITEKGMLLTVCHKREAHDPSAVLKRIREDIDGSSK